MLGAGSFCERAGDIGSRVFDGISTFAGSHASPIFSMFYLQCLSNTLLFPFAWWYNRSVCVII